MNRVFYVLLFLTISGFGVLWWLFNSLPPEEEVVTPVENHGLVIHDTKKDDAHHSETGKEADAHGAESHAEAAQANDPTASAHADDKAHGEAGSHAEASAQHDDHAATGEGGGENKADAHGVDTAPAVKEGDEVAVNVGKSSLFVESQPQGALVYLDGVLKGKTPFTFDIMPTDKVVRFDLEGYERQERTIEDRHHETGSLTRWKIELVAKNASPSTSANAAGNPSADYRFVGKQGPFFIQLKAIESSKNSGWLMSVQGYRETLTDKKVSVCEVDLGSKGRWTRFLVGPFNSKSEAQGALSLTRKRSSESEAFVVGEQKCLE